MSIKDTLNQRNTTHGDFVDVAARYSQLKFGAPKLTNPALQLALDSIKMKIARIEAGDSTFADHWHDIAGYATLAEKELTKGEEYVSLPKYGDDVN